MRSGKVLILESDERLEQSWTSALSQEGYCVSGVSGTEEAIEAAREQAYDLLVIRAEEPELLNMLLAQFPPEMGVLIVAREEAMSSAVECAGMGIYSFLIEPFGLRKFKEKVAQAIDRSRSVENSLRGKMLITLEQANRLLASEAETSQFFELVLEMGANGTKADYSSLAVKDEITGKFVIKAERGDSKASWKKICQEVMEPGEPILIDETMEDDSPLHRLMTEAKISSLLCIPLVINGDVIGAMNHIKAGKGARFESSDLSFASILGWWSTMAIENARLFGRVQKQHLHVEELLHEISLAQENERRRVAIQIHDGVAQWMVGASYSIQACSSLISESKLAELEHELYNIEKTLRRSVKELRRAIADLRPLPLEEVGLVEAIHRAVEELGEEGIKCHTQVDGELPELSVAEENTTYWIVQEVLTNIRNHSGAGDVYLRIQFSDSTVSVEVSDNGRGFNPDEVLSSTVSLEHMGLQGMQERAKLLGANLVISSNPGQGTLVCLTFPVSSRVVMKTTG